MIHVAHFIGAYLVGYLLYLPAIACVDEFMGIEVDGLRVVMAHVFGFAIALLTL
jgi:hypothetical protein